MKRINIILILIFCSLGIKAQSIAYSYDNLGRLIKVNYPDSSQINYSYDASGNRLSAKIKDQNYHSPQTITFTHFATTTYGSPDFVPDAAASSGLPLTYGSSNSSVAAISNGKLHIIGIGSSVITISQSGNATFEAAISVVDTLKITPAILNVKVNDTSKIYGAANPGFKLTYAGFAYAEDTTILTVKPIISTTATVNSPVGTYPINVSGAAAANYTFNYIFGNLTIKPIPPPTIVSFTPDAAMVGTTITITGTYFTNVTAVSFGNIPASSFVVNSPTSISAVVGNGVTGTVSVTTPSGIATLSGFNFVFNLPAANFKVSTTSATCKGSNNGIINISAQQTLSYTATITGSGVNNSYPFFSSQDIKNLAAGTYSVCIAVGGQPDYKQCFDVVITEPKDLSLYSTINSSINSITLALGGGTQYNIQLNDVLYTTSESTITLPLKEGNNKLAVSTDKLCQGIIEKLINVSGSIVPYPDPFQNTLNLNLGNEPISNVSVEIHNVSDGKLVFFKQYVNQGGVLQLDLSNFKNGVYALHLSMDRSEKLFKIMKR